MTVMWLRTLFFCWLIFFCPSAGAWDDQATFTVSGTVVNSATGQPVPRALVWIMGATRQSGFSASDGTFKFSGIVRGEYICAANKPGFSFGPDAARHNPFEPVHVTADVSKLVVKLVPEGIITGHIEDPEHEPLPNAYVGVASYDVQNGRRRLVRRGDTRTDEDGNYRIAGLKADDYFVITGSTGSVPPITSKSGDQRDWGYQYVAYPNVDSIKSASPVHVDPGQRVDASFSPKPQRVFHVSGKVLGMSQTTTQIWFEREDLPFYGIYFPVNPANGSFNARWIPAGDYILYLNTRGDNPFGARQRLTVTSDLDGIVLQLEPPVKVPVVVRWTPAPNTQQDGRLRSFVMLEMMPDEWWASPHRQNGSVETPGAGFSLENVYPGHYRVSARVFGQGLGGLHIVSMTSGNVDLLRQKLVVSSGAPMEPIEVVMEPDSGTIEVKPPAGESCWLVAVPLFAPMLDPSTTMCGRNGTAELSQLTPGDYNVYLLDTLDQVPYAEPEFAKAYESKAAHVTVPAGGKVVAQPALIRKVQ